MNKILVTGGTGRLGTELKKHIEADYVSFDDYDIAMDANGDCYDLIVHMAAYTNVVKAEKNTQRCYMTNVVGTASISREFSDTPIIYISTEYANKPLGVYAITKYLGEEVIKLHSSPYLILRTAFKPTPWPFDMAYEDQYTQGDYVDVIAKLLAKRIKTWDRKTSGLEYLGTGRKTMLELAKRTKPNVKSNKIADYKHHELIPYDYQ